MQTLEYTAQFLQIIQLMSLRVPALIRTAVANVKELPSFISVVDGERLVLLDLFQRSNPNLSFTIIDVCLVLTVGRAAMAYETSIVPHLGRINEKFGYRFVIPALEHPWREAVLLTLKKV